MRRAAEYAARLPVLVPLCLRSGVRLGGLRKSEDQRRELLTAPGSAGFQRVGALPVEHRT